MVRKGHQAGSKSCWPSRARVARREYHPCAFQHGDYKEGSQVLRRKARRGETEARHVWVFDP